MPLLFNVFIDQLRTNLNISDQCSHLSIPDIKFITSLLKENIEITIEICNEIQMIEKEGILQVNDIIQIIFLIHKFVANLIKAKRSTKVNFLNVEKFILEALVFKLLQFPDGIKEEDIKKVLDNSFELLKIKPKIKFSFWSFFF